MEISDGTSHLFFTRVEFEYDSKMTNCTRVKNRFTRVNLESNTRDILDSWLEYNNRVLYSSQESSTKIEYCTRLLYSSQAFWNIYRGVLGVKIRYFLPWAWGYVFVQRSRNLGLNLIMYFIKVITNKTTNINLF